MNIRELMRYIEKEIMDPIISDFEDRIDRSNDAEDEAVDFTVTIDDFKSLKEKVEDYIKNHKSEPLVSQVSNFEKTTDDAVESFKVEVQKLSKNREEYANLFESERDITILVRKVIGIDQKAINAFIDMQSEKGFSERQLYYIKELLLFISQNGKFERSDLLRQELLFGDLFDNTQINSIIKEVESRL